MIKGDYCSQWERRFQSLYIAGAEGGGFLSAPRGGKARRSGAEPCPAGAPLYAGARLRRSRGRAMGPGQRPPRHLPSDRPLDLAAGASSGAVLRLP